MKSVAQIEELILPALNDMGFDVVRIMLTGGQKPTLQVMADRLDEEAITVEDCATISRAISAILDVEDPIDDAYTLEVSSPGIDRPLVKPRDFERFAGYEAKVEMNVAIDGQRRFRGRLLGFVEDHIHLEIEHNGDMVEIALPYDDFYRAKLVMSDELVAGASEQTGTETD
ncbi:ribosome maturation factor RimP [Aestuariispira insulae]|uniref:Ribosome maturation factor RimP n=1 Tax=Aestuariispira insulae TaxID=1461337 RepID=A0A3D9HQ31_9PROT|nr:ribosome maturation factor RimP [Aestuariispira insulae]RED51505.1 ribosome maturation factor RimP [Aestuariispira insulae]